MTPNATDARAPALRDDAPPIHMPLAVRPRRERYAALALVSHPRHLDRLDPRDESTLVVASEWFAWQVATELGFDAVHTDAFTLDRPHAAGHHADVYLDACAWIFASGRDLTLYRGVSLGQLCGTYLTLGWQAAAGIHAALERLCAELHPKRLVLFDLSAQYGALGEGAKRTLLGLIAGRFGCAVEDRFDPLLLGDPLSPQRIHVGPTGPRAPAWRDRLRDLYAAGIDALFRLRLWTLARKPRVFLLLSLASLGQLVGAFSRPRDLVPAFDAATSPKSLRFLGECWRKGIVLVRVPAPQPLAAREQACFRIKAAVEDHWRRTPAAGLEAVHRRLVRDVLFAPGILAELAGMVDRYAGLVDRLGAARIVVTDATPPLGQALCQIARARGIPADESHNGVFITAVKDPIRCGHGPAPAMLSRLLAFGPAAVEWLRAIGSPAEAVVTGYPALGRVPPGRLAPPRLRNALVLPVYAWTNDVGARRAQLAPALLRLIRSLAGAGAEEIRLRIHPSVDNPDFYRTLLDHFRLPGAIAAGSFADCLAWADVVIGPPGTSCFLETLAAGKPYYVLRPEPTAITDAMLPGAVVAARPEDLVAQIAQGRVPDRDRLLAFWIGLGQVDDPRTATWDAIERGTAR